MTITSTPGALKKFRRTPWRFQQTVELPDAGGLERFVEILITTHGGLRAATITIDEVIFHTVRISALYPAGAALTHDVSLIADSMEEVRDLLLAVLWDGPDCACIPTPKPFVMYADHDGWITFYANTKGNLNHVIDPLASYGYKLVQNWQREP